MTREIFGIWCTSRWLRMIPRWRRVFLCAHTAEIIGSSLMLMIMCSFSSSGHNSLQNEYRGNTADKILSASVPQIKTFSASCCKEDVATCFSDIALCVIVFSFLGVLFSSSFALIPSSTIIITWKLQPFLCWKNSTLYMFCAVKKSADFLPNLLLWHTLLNAV